MEATPFSIIFSLIDTSLESFLTEKAKNLIEYIRGPVWVFYSVYVIYGGYEWWFGRTEEPVKEMVFRFFRMAVIVTLALEPVIYTSEIVSFFRDAPAEIVAGVKGDTTPKKMGENLDDLMGRIFNVGYSVFDEAGWTDITPFFLAVFIFAAGVFVTVGISFIVLMAQIAMTLILLLGPIAIASLLFKTTAKLFDAWLGQLLNYMLLLVLASSLGEIILGFSKDYLNSIIQNNTDLKINADGKVSGMSGKSVVPNAIAFCIGLLVSIQMVRQIPGMAAALGGGIQLAIGNPVTGAARQFARGATMAGKGAHRAGRAGYQLARRLGGAGGNKIGGGNKRSNTVEGK